MIYFAQEGDSGPIKIGYSEVELLRFSRVMALQSGNPTKLHVRVVR